MTDKEGTMSNEVHAERQMETIGTLPDGRPLYYAQPGLFEKPGLWTWNQEKGEHVPVTISWPADDAPESERPAPKGRTLADVRSWVEEVRAREHNQAREVPEGAWNSYGAGFHQGASEVLDQLLDYLSGDDSA